MSMYNDPSDAQQAPWSNDAAPNERSQIDVHLEDSHLAESVAGGPLDGEPDFRLHECWRKLHSYPDETDQTIPGQLICAGCGAVYRAELEHKP